jgi:pyruvate/2-oxoglutarate dehydrogenase complex dihydrolipoamide acyltransferase (E2) component
VGPATFDVPAPVTGRLVEIRGREEDRVEQGEVLGFVAEADDEESSVAGDD